MALEFLSNAPAGMDRVLQVLASAESLTDDVAKQLYALAPIEGVSAALLIRSLHYADFIEPRNSEWSFNPEVRLELQKLKATSPEVIREANRMLAEIGGTADRALAGSMVPAYLFTAAGKAYHEAAAGNTTQALSLYSEVALGRLNGVQWLASNLAAEQEERSILPPNSIETNFLRAMVMFREGNRRAAEPLFRRIASSDEARIEVGIALHLLGNMVARTNRAEAEAFFRRSIAIGEEIGDRGGVGQRLHSLANLLARDRSRAKEAEEAYRRSVAIGEEIGDRGGVGQRLHSLANLIARDGKRVKEAEHKYLQSIALGEALDDQYGVAQRLHSLADLIARDKNRAEEAEESYLRSIRIGDEIGNQHHVAQTLHGLANLLAADPLRISEAEEKYLRAIELLEQAGDGNGVAQTLRSYSFLVEKRSAKEAEQLLLRALVVNKRIGNREGERIVNQSLRSLRERFDL